MSLAAFLAELRRRDIRVWADGEQLRCDAPAGTLTPGLREELRRHKSDVLEFLNAAQTLAHQPRAIVPLRRHGARAAVFGVAGHNGDVFCYRALVRHLGEDQPFFGLEPPGLDGESAPLTTVEDLAAYFASQIRAIQPDGPYVIAGYCAGGTVAFELGRQLLRAGAGVDLVALFGSPYPNWYRFPAYHVQRGLRSIERIKDHLRELASRSPQERGRYLAKHFHNRKARLGAERAAADPVLIRRAQVERATLAAVRRYKPRHFAGRIGLFLPSVEWKLVGGAQRRWQATARQTEEYFGPAGCDGENMLLPSHAPAFAELFRRSLERIGRATAQLHPLEGGRAQA